MPESWFCLWRRGDSWINQGERPQLLLFWLLPTIIGLSFASLNLKVLLHLSSFVFPRETRLYAFGFTALCHNTRRFFAFPPSVLFKVDSSPRAFACVHFCSFMCTRSLKRRCDLQLWETFLSLPFLQNVITAPAAAFPQEQKRKNKTPIFLLAAKWP